MIISNRVKNLKTSVTLKLNELANQLAAKGQTIYNLTAGQLPFHPPQEFVNLINAELKFMKSFQYSPVGGVEALCEKLMSYIEGTRNIHWDRSKYGAIISNGAKHSIFNLLGALINPGDEVVFIAPYWISYPPMVESWGGVCASVTGKNFHGFIPYVQNVEKIITDKTRVIILNAPNNPTGVNYNKEWMEEFAVMIKKYPQIAIISDEIYYSICYFDPTPYYFYHHDSSLLERTFVVDGISKTMACTGLRIGVTIGPKEIISACNKLQGHTTSGANSLVQQALNNYPLEHVEEYLLPIRTHLRNNANTIRNIFRDKSLAHLWYQTTAAFYFMVDFSLAPVFKKYHTKTNVPVTNEDYSNQICQDLLEKYGVAIVPGTDFGLPNSGRLSLVMENNIFTKAIELLATFLNDSP